MAKKVVYELNGVAYNVAPNSVYEIQKVSLGKRAFAFVVDMALFVLLAIGIGKVLTNPIADNYFNYQSIIQDWQNETIDFGFARIDSVSGEYVQIDFAEEEEELETLIQVHGVELASEGLATFDDDTAKYVIEGEIEDKVEALESIFYTRPNVMAIAKRKTFADFVKTGVSSLFGQLFIFLLFPLIFKNGQTLGKKIARVGVVNSDGLKVKSLAIVLRFLIGFFLIETLITIILYSISPLFGLVIVFLFVGIAMFTKQNQALHDLIGRTVVVDMDAQYIIDTIEEKIEAQRLEYKEYLADQKNKKVVKS